MAKRNCKKKNFNAIVKNSTDQISNVSLQGPKSREILKKIIFTPPTQPSIDELGWFRFTICRIEEFRSLKYLKYFLKLLRKELKTCFTVSPITDGFLAIVTPPPLKALLFQLHFLHKQIL